MSDINPRNRLMFFLAFGAFAALGLYATDEIVPKLPEKKPPKSAAGSIVDRGRRRAVEPQQPAADTGGQERAV